MEVNTTLCIPLLRSLSRGSPTRLFTMPESMRKVLLLSLPLTMAARPVEDTNLCTNSSQALCGAAGSKYCAQACAWNASASVCQQVDNYPMPTNESLAELVGPDSPLVDYMTISFYGDSITWLNVYEPLILAAIHGSPHTAHLNVRMINQGVNGGTIKDLVAGSSPWGHLDPSVALSNITFLETLQRDQPTVVVRACSRVGSIRARGGWRRSGATAGVSKGLRSWHPRVGYFWCGIQPASPHAPPSPTGSSDWHQRRDAGRPRLRRALLQRDRVRARAAGGDRKARAGHHPASRDRLRLHHRRGP